MQIYQIYFNRLLNKISKLEGSARSRDFARLSYQYRFERTYTPCISLLSWFPSKQTFSKVVIVSTGTWRIFNGSVLRTVLCMSPRSVCKRQWGFLAFNSIILFILTSDTKIAGWTWKTRSVSCTNPTRMMRACNVSIFGVYRFCKPNKDLEVVFEKLVSIYHRLVQIMVHRDAIKRKTLTFTHETRWKENKRNGTSDNKL